jgi:AcrR family transcriptional regulator
MIRAMIGGLQKVVHKRLYRDEQDELVELAPQIWQWWLSYPPPPGPLRATRRRSQEARPFEERQAVGNPAERVLRALAATVAEKGYPATTVAEVVERASTSQRTFYEHFANKEECILALFDAANQLLLTRILGAVAEAGEDPVARMREGMREFLVVIDAYPAQAQTLLVEIIGAGPAAMRRRDEIVASFAQVLFRENETQAQESVMPRFKSSLDAFAIVGAIAELVSRQLRLGEPEHSADLQPVIERFAFGLLGIEPPPLAPAA